MLNVYPNIFIQVSFLDGFNQTCHHILALCDQALARFGHSHFSGLFRAAS